MILISFYYFLLIVEVSVDTTSGSWVILGNSKFSGTCSIIVTPPTIFTLLSPFLKYTPFEFE